MTRWDAIKTKFLLLSKGEKLIFAFIVSFIVSLLPAGFFAAFMVGEWSAGLLRMLKLSVTTSYGLAIALIFAFALTFAAAMVFRKNMDLNGAKEIDDRGMITSNAGTYGTAEWMSEAEAKQVYEVGPVEKVTGTILGQFTQEGEEVIALPFEPTGNRNLILIGPPGSGKSFGYVRTAVFQSIVRGESVVVTDPKGEIHNDMRKLLEANGYKVKVFNLINLDLSNAWDCVQEIYDPITGNIDDQRVITFCKTVITNTGGGAGGDPFWESSEENLFRVAVSYCAFMRETTLIKIYERRTKELLTQLPFITEEDGNKLIEIVKNPESAMFDRRKVVEYLAENFYGKEEGSKKLQSWEDDAPTCNISDIYNALLHNDLNSWEDNFKNVPLNHPAASAWAVFKGMGERVQPNIVGGLNTRLQLFMTYKVRRVISNDDIRLANIGAEKTALFLIISDDNASMQLLSSLLLSFLFKDLKEAFDAVGGEGRIPVNVVADELANTGVWPNFEKTIATARSRKIAVSLILQSLPQLTQLYGEENAETIIGCCNTMLVLGCNDKYTAEYISDKSGIVTIRAKSVSDSRASTIGLRGAMQGYGGGCKAVDGQFISMDPSSVNSINIMDIRVPDDEDAKDMDEYSAGSLLTKKIHTIKSFMHLVVKDLTQEEEQLIDTCLIMVYKKFGITNDNNSIYDRETGQYKKMPLLQDLHKEMLKYPELHRISNILNPLITGSMACYNRPTNVDLKAKYIVFDFNGMKGAILTMSMFVVLDFVWTKIKEDRKKRKAVFIDECWKLIGTDSNEMAAEDVVEIFRTIRAYGGSAFAMTQDISQFYEYKGGKYGKAIIGNADTKIIMHLIPSEAQALQAAIQLTDAEMENVSSLQRGQGLVCSSSAKLFVDFVAADYEKQEITTDAKNFYMQEKALKEKQHQEEQARLEAEDKEKPAKTDDNSEEH